MRRLWGYIVALICCIVGLGTAEANTATLSPRAIIDRVLVENLQLLASAENVGSAEADLMASKGQFDVRLASGIDHRIDKSAVSAPTIFGTRTDTTRFRLDAIKRWSSGTDTFITYATDRSRTFNSSFIQPTLHRSGLTFGVRQPFLRNMIGKINRGTVAQAREAYNAASYTHQRRVQEIVRQGLGFYWRWIIARRSVQAARDALAHGQQFLTITQERHRLGTALDTDLYVAKGLVEQRRAVIRLFEVEVTQAERDLKIALHYDPDTALAPAHDSLPTTPPPRPMGEAMNQALANRPDYLSARHTADQLNIKLENDKNGVWPQLDLVSTIEANQLATSSLGAALTGMDNPNWFIGLEFSVPLPNRAARGTRNRSAHEQMQALYEVQFIESQIGNEIAELNKRLQLLNEETQLRVRDEAMRLSRLVSEEEQYRLGRSSSEFVRIAQDDYYQARVVTLEARDRWHQAWLDYQLALAALP